MKILNNHSWKFFLIILLLAVIFIFFAVDSALAKDEKTIALQTGPPGSSSSDFPGPGDLPGTVFDPDPGSSAMEEMMDASEGITSDSPSEGQQAAEQMMDLSQGATPSATGGNTEQWGAGSPIKLKSLKAEIEKAKINEVWKWVLGLIDYLVAIFLIFIAFVNILHINIDTYAVKKALPGIILGVILANLSWFFCMALTELATAVAQWEFDLVPGGPVVGIYQELFGPIIGLAAGAGGVAMLAAVLTGFAAWGPAGLLGFFLGLIIVLVPIILFAAVFFLLYVRYFVVMALIIASPLAFFALGFPLTTKYFQQWWDLFWKWLFMAPIALFLWVIAYKIATLMGDNQLTKYIFICASIYFSLRVPFMLGGAIMAAWGGIGAAVTGTGKGGFFQRKASEVWQGGKVAAGLTARKVPGLGGVITWSEKQTGRLLGLQEIQKSMTEEAMKKGFRTEIFATKYDKEDSVEPLRQSEVRKLGNILSEGPVETSANYLIPPEELRSGDPMKRFRHLAAQHSLQQMERQVGREQLEKDAVKAILAGDAKTATEKLSSTKMPGGKRLSSGEKEKLADNLKKSLPLSRTHPGGPILNVFNLLNAMKKGMIDWRPGKGSAESAISANPIKALANKMDSAIKSGQKFEVDAETKGLLEKIDESIKNIHAENRGQISAEDIGHVQGLYNVAVKLDSEKLKNGLQRPMDQISNLNMAPLEMVHNNPELAGFGNKAAIEDLIKNDPANYGGFAIHQVNKSNLNSLDQPHRKKYIEMVDAVMDWQRGEINPNVQMAIKKEEARARQILAGEFSKAGGLSLDLDPQTITVQQRFKVNEELDAKLDAKIAATTDVQEKNKYHEIKNTVNHNLDKIHYAQQADENLTHIKEQYGPVGKELLDRMKNIT